MNQEDPEQLTPLIQSSFENDPGVSPEIRPVFINNPSQTPLNFFYFRTGEGHETMSK